MAVKPIWNFNQSGGVPMLLSEGGERLGYAEKYVLEVAPFLGRILR
jgi:hypothetical protein